MKHGHLSQYFQGVAAKYLSVVEADTLRSNQHEFNGVESLKEIFGQATGHVRMPARFLYLTDADDEPVTANGFLTWYDARAKHPTRSEHRLYFPTTSVSQCAAAGDLLVIGKRSDGSILVITAEGGSTTASQILWLFGLADLTHPGFSVRSELQSGQDRIAFASRVILEEIGIEVEERDENYLDEMLRRFGGEFPSTAVFSAYARSTIRQSPRDQPDATLIAFMEREEILFRTLERHLIGERLRQGFGGDVDDFIAYSLSVQNRRKSRVGWALENHLASVLSASSIEYSRGQVTENRSRPDFMFPSIDAYRNPKFPLARLTMLGVKSTCKDRWRQVLAEADRMEAKHLLTLEPSISSSQTAEMRAKQLQLVLPQQLHETYLPAQRSALMDVQSFVSMVRGRQSTAPA